MSVYQGLRSRSSFQSAGADPPLLKCFVEGEVGVGVVLDLKDDLPGAE